MQRCLMALLIGVSMSMAAAQTQAQETACAIDMRAALDQACGCDAFISHAQYMKCVRGQLKAFSAQGCKTAVPYRCAARSICSNVHIPVVCCPKKGRPAVTSAARCTARGGTVMTGVTSLCDAVCPVPSTPTRVPTRAPTNTPVRTPTPGAAQINVIALHDSTSSRYNWNCTQCHADVLTESSLNPSIPAIHVVMRPYAPGQGNTQCVWCHRTVDLVQGVQSAAKSKAPLRKLVDPVLCSVCHLPGGPAKQLYQTGPSRTNPDGAQLYDLVCAPCHGELARSEVRGKSASEIWSKINENEGGMGPLRVLSTQQIQAIANALAQ